MLDTYEADRLPVMRGVLTHTDSLTTMIGTGNPLVRTLFNHVGPFIGGTDRVQENAATNMSQIGLDYRKSPLSVNHAHTGTVRAGDRLPEVTVRPMGNMPRESRLLPLLDASRFTLLVATPDGAACRDELRTVLPDSRFVQVAPPDVASLRERYLHVFGPHGVAILVRPDGYAALTSSIDDAAGHVAAFARRWLTPS